MDTIHLMSAFLNICFEHRLDYNNNCDRIDGGEFSNFHCTIGHIFILLDILRCVIFREILSTRISIQQNYKNMLQPVNRLFEYFLMEKIGLHHQFIFININCSLKHMHNIGERDKHGIAHAPS